MPYESPPSDRPLKRFAIEQYEVHVAIHEVVARSAANAIRRLFNGDGDIACGSEYLGSCEERGLPLAEHRALAEELARIGVPLPDTVVPSIRAVYEIDDDGVRKK